MARTEIATASAEWDRKRAMGSTMLSTHRASGLTVSAAALALVAATFGYWTYSERTSPRWADLSTPRGSLHVLVANDPAERSQGLSHRDNLPGDGLLLQWDGPGRHPIWMAGMRFPLDLVWLESDGRIAAVLINVPICLSPPCPLYEPAGTNQAIAVLELAAGAVANHGIELGSEIHRSTSSSHAR